MVSLDILPRILETRKLISRNGLPQELRNLGNIANREIVARRTVKQVTCEPYGVVDDYVPFYLSPRTRMLYAIHMGNVPDCNIKQDDVVYLCSNAEIIVNAGLPFVFTDYSAAVGYSNFFNNLSDLNRIDWPLFFEPPLLAGYCTYCHSPASVPRYVKRGESRQAEFMVKNELSLDFITEIIVKEAALVPQVQALLNRYGHSIVVRVERGWYY